MQSLFTNTQAFTHSPWFPPDSFRSLCYVHANVLHAQMAFQCNESLIIRKSSNKNNVKRAINIESTEQNRKHQQLKLVTRAGRTQTTKKKRVRKKIHLDFITNSCLSQFIVYLSHFLEDNPMKF